MANRILRERDRKTAKVKDSKMEYVIFDVCRFYNLQGNIPKGVVYTLHIFVNLLICKLLSIFLFLATTTVDILYREK